MSIKFEIFNMQPVMTNSILISEGNDCVIIDPWGQIQDWLDLLESRQLKLRGIYCTHGHGDHIAVAPQLAQHFGIDWFMNSDDIPVLIGANWLLGHFGLPDMPDNYKQPKELNAGIIDVLPNLSAEIIELPGHSPGGIAMYFSAQKIILIGDTIFQDCIGRYDLPGSDYNSLMESVAKIYNMDLPEDTTVVHGHGENTNIGFLKKHNKYFKL